MIVILIGLFLIFSIGVVRVFGGINKCIVLQQECGRARSLYCMKWAENKAEPDVPKIPCGDEICFAEVKTCKRIGHEFKEVPCPVPTKETCESALGMNITEE